MRTLLFILLISFNTISQSIKSTYSINHKSKTYTYVLQLCDSNRYRVVEFNKTNPNVIVDAGTYSEKNIIFLKFIKLKSEKKWKIMQILDHKNYTIIANKLWENPTDPLLKKNYKAILTNDTNLQKIPVIKKYPENKNVTKTFFTNNIKKYSPTYLNIIEEYYCGPGCYFKMVNNKMQEWDGDTTHKVLMDQYVTMVHETTHKHNGSNGYNWETRLWNNKILIQPGIEVLFPGTPTFKSELLITSVPKDAPKKIFRWETYVSHGKTTSANENGIYGLMDEFSAYRNATRCAIESANTAIKLGELDKASIFQDGAVGEYFAYYEFRLFIALYLEYAQKNKPDIYKKIMENTNLRIAFTLLDDGFRSDIRELEILVKNNSWSYDYNEKEYAQYVKDLLVNHEKTLSNFKMGGVNKQNYKEKLK